MTARDLKEIKYQIESVNNLILGNLKTPEIVKILVQTVF